jgi:hypothetical protein
MSCCLPRRRMAALAALALVAGAYGMGGIDARAQEGAPQPLSPLMRGAVEKSRAAIIECRARRLRGEIPTYKASAQCSNPKIFAAWQEAHYPHMDLITEWLNAREDASEKVDKETMSPKDFEDDMGALTMRLTTEEKRRHVGMMVSSDGEMQFRLPPATQVVGVATPAGDEKLAAKKTAAARERAAAAASAGVADAASGVSMASLAQFASLDTDKARSPAGLAAAGPPGEGSSGLYAQIGAQRNEAEAQSIYRYLQTRYPALSGRDAVIRRVDEGNLGTYYRLEVGPLSAAEANELCGAIRTGGGLCVPRAE